MMEKYNIEIILPSFTQLYPPKIVHIDGAFECMEYLSEAFKSAEKTLLTAGPFNGKSLSSQKQTAVEKIDKESGVVFSNKEEEAIYYSHSLKSMSSLVSADLLTPFWKNIKNIASNPVKTATLDKFYSSAVDTETGDVNWLCLGGLKSLNAIKGLGGRVDNIQGLLIYTLIEDGPDTEKIGCYQPDLESYLRDKGLVQVASFETRHPSFELGLYVRDFAPEFAEIKKALQVEQAQKRQIDIEKTELSDVHNQTLNQLSKLEQAHALTLTSLSALEKEKVIWQTEKDKFEKIETLLLSSLSQLKSELKSEQDLTSLKSEVEKLATLPTMLSDMRFQNFLQSSKDPEKVRTLWCHLAEKFYKNQHFPQAAEYFQLALDAKPSDAWCMQGLAESMARSNAKPTSFWYVPDSKIHMDQHGRWDAVVRMYRKALAIDPNISNRFNQKFPSKTLGEGPDAIDNPIFIVGCGHSGTSILLRIIGNHKNIWPVKKESSFFLRPDRHAIRQMSGWDQDCVADNKARWVEKTPPHIFQIPRLIASRPKSQIILITRDGRDVVASLKHRSGYENIQDRIDRWVYDNMAGLPYWDNERVHVLKYEDLIGKTEKTLKDLCKFLKEPYDSNMINYHEKKEHWYSDELVQPKEITDEQEIQAFEASKAQGLLETLGYPHLKE